MTQHAAGNNTTAQLESRNTSISEYKGWVLAMHVPKTVQKGG